MTAQSTKSATGEMIRSTSSLVMGEVALMSTYTWSALRKGWDARASGSAMSALTAETTISLRSISACWLGTSSTCASAARLPISSAAGESFQCLS